MCIFENASVLYTKLNSLASTLDTLKVLQPIQNLQDMEGQHFEPTHSQSFVPIHDNKLWKSYSEQ